MMFRFARRSRETAEPVWVDLSIPDTLGRFSEAASFWAAGGVDGARDTIMLACDLLVEGLDSPALRDLASFAPDAGWWDSRDVLETTFAELGLEFYDRDSDEAGLLALRFLCRSFLTGVLAERELVRSAYALFDFQVPAAAGELVDLEHLYGYAEVVSGRRGNLSALAEKCAREFLVATADL